LRGKTFRLFSLVTLCFFLVACTQTDTINGKQIGKPLGNVLSTPDKIIFYNKDNRKELDKTDENFNKIVDLTNKRFHNKMSTAQDIIQDDGSGVINRDGLGVEFIYFDEKEMSIKGDGFQPFKYNKLYFQLTSEKYGNAQGSPVHSLQYGDKDQYKGSSRGPLKYSEELVNLVSNLKTKEEVLAQINLGIMMVEEGIDNFIKINPTRSKADSLNSRGESNLKNLALLRQLKDDLLSNIISPSTAWNKVIEIRDGKKQ